MIFRLCHPAAVNLVNTPWDIMESPQRLVSFARPLLCSEACTTYSSYTEKVSVYLSLSQRNTNILNEQDRR